MSLCLSCEAKGELHYTLVISHVVGGVVWLCTGLPQKELKRVPSSRSTVASELHNSLKSLNALGDALNAVAVGNDKQLARAYKSSGLTTLLSETIRPGAKVRQCAQCGVVGNCGWVVVCVTCAAFTVCAHQVLLMASVPALEDGLQSMPYTLPFLTRSLPGPSRAATSPPRGSQGTPRRSRGAAGGK